MIQMKAMETSNKRPTRMYKVVYEELKTRKHYTVYVESTSSYEAGESVLEAVGEETHDLILAVSAKPHELN